MAIPILLAFATLAIWIGLVFFRSGFWRVQMPQPSPAPQEWPAVVAIIPARNESALLSETLCAILRQDYPGSFETVLVDDHSTDGTAARAVEIASACECTDRLHVVAARTLPPGWTGKVWAQSEGLARADALSPVSYVWLTDADIWHAPDTLSRLVSRAKHEGRVLTSLMVRLRCESWAERALIPAFVYFFAKLYPFRAVNDISSRAAGAAGGCMLADRDALRQIGGLHAIRDELIDDCALAAAMKKVGPIRLDFADSSVSLRPYSGWGSIWDMIARSAFTQLHYSAWLLLGTVFGMALAYLAPPLLTFTRGSWVAAMAWLLMALSYLPILGYYRRSRLWAPLLPLVALVYLGATLDSARRYWRGTGGQWKGRAQATLRR